MKQIVICRDTLAEMIAHLEAVLPEEGCGLLGSADGVLCRHFPVENRLHSPTAFEFEPKQMVKAMVQMPADEMFAIYHSHPVGLPIPSEQDIALAAYPEAATLIVGWDKANAPIVRGYRLEMSDFIEIPVAVV